MYRPYLEMVWYLPPRKALFIGTTHVKDSEHRLAQGKQPLCVHWHLFWTYLKLARSYISPSMAPLWNLSPWSDRSRRLPRPRMETSSFVSPGTRDFVACNHLRSYKYYSESILNPDGFASYPCASYKAFESVSYYPLSPSVGRLSTMFGICSTLSPVSDHLLLVLHGPSEFMIL